MDFPTICATPDPSLGNFGKILKGFMKTRCIGKLKGSVVVMAMVMGISTVLAVKNIIPIVKPDQMVVKPPHLVVKPPHEILPPSSRLRPLRYVHWNPDSPKENSVPTGGASGAHQAVENLLSKLQNVVEEDLQSHPSVSLDITGDIRRIQAFGELGSKAVRDFIDSQQDLVIVDGNFGSNGRGRLYEFPTIRTTLLEVLCDLNDPNAEAASLEVLKHTPLGLEALLAARNLEQNFPGKYRAEALESAKAISLNPLDERKYPQARWSAEIFQIFGYYQPKEMIPQIEDIVQQRGGLWADCWIRALLQFPAGTQVPAIQKLMNDGKQRDVGHLGYMDFRNPTARQMVYEIFRKLPLLEKATILKEIGHPESCHYLTYLMPPKDPIRRDRVEGCLQMLDLLSPDANTSGASRDLQQARANLQVLFGKIAKR